MTMTPAEQKDQAFAEKLRSDRKRTEGKLVDYAQTVAELRQVFRSIATAMEGLIADVQTQKKILSEPKK